MHRNNLRLRVAAGVLTLFVLMLPLSAVQALPWQDPLDGSTGVAEAPADDWGVFGWLWELLERAWGEEGSSMDPNG